MTDLRIWVGVLADYNCGRLHGQWYSLDDHTDAEELEAAVGAELAPPDLEEEIDTVAGLVTALAGRVPQRGEVIPHSGGFEFQVTDADPRRVKRVRVRRLPEPDVVI